MDISVENHLKFADFLAHFLDASFNIGSFRFGASALIDLIPGLGDIVATVLSLYLIWLGVKMEIPTHALARMIGNVLLRFVFGLIPFAGDLAYFFYKTNMKNLDILRQYAGKQTPNPRLASA